MSTLSYSAIMTERSLNGRSSTDTKGVRAKFEVRRLNFWYGPTQALFNVSLRIPERSVVALIGPSGCGKSTFLRTLNRMNDLIEGTRHGGDVLLDGSDISSRAVDLAHLRRRVGMVFQKSNPFPKSIFENVVYGPRVAGLRDRGRLKRCASAVCGGPPCGKRSRIGCTPRRWTCPAASSSGCALPGPWPPTPRCCCSTNRPPPSTRPRPCTLRT